MPKYIIATIFSLHLLSKFYTLVDISVEWSFGRNSEIATSGTPKL